MLVSRPDSSRGREYGKQSLVFKLSKMGVAEMGGVTMLKLVGYYLYSCTDLVSLLHSLLNSRPATDCSRMRNFPRNISYTIEIFYQEKYPE